MLSGHLRYSSRPKSFKHLRAAQLPDFAIFITSMIGISKNCPGRTEYMLAWHFSEINACTDLRRSAGSMPPIKVMSAPTHCPPFGSPAGTRGWEGENLIALPNARRRASSWRAAVSHAARVRWIDGEGNDAYSNKPPNQDIVISFCSKAKTMSVPAANTKV